MNNSMYLPKRLFLGTLFAMQLLNSTNAAVEIEVQTSTIGHQFRDLHRPPIPKTVQDFLVDQDQASGGGGILPDVSVNWDTNSQFTLTVSAPPGKKFLVRVPAGRAVGFGAFLWWESTRGGFSPQGSVAASFDGLEGTPPGFSTSTSVLSDSHGFFGFGDLGGTLVTNDFAFTSIRLTATVTPQYTGNGTEDYLPHHESGMQLYYQTMETNDPGRFVFIVPVDSTPTNNLPPVVNLTAPANDAVFAPRTPIFLTASVTDENGAVSFVDFFAGSRKLGRVIGTPANGLYNWVWTNALPGTYQLRAEAADDAGAIGVSTPVEIIVSAGTNAPPTNMLPVVKLTQPTNGAVFSADAAIWLTANATDEDGMVNVVDFFAGPFNLGRVIGTPADGLYHLVWSNAPPGTFQLRAEAVDNGGDRAISDAVEITVTAGTNAPPTNNVAPVVNLSRPRAGLAFATGSPIFMTASAMDADGIVSFVDFFADSVYLGRGVYSPADALYRFVWSNAPAGTFQLRAEAMDNSGERSISASAAIEVGARAVVDLGRVEVSTIGHTLFDLPFPRNPGASSRSVVDVLIDQDQSSAGGAVLPAVSVNWDTNTVFKLTIAAPLGKKFVVAVPAGRTVRFAGFLWWESTRGGFSPPGQVTAHFTDLEGTAPEFTESDSVLSDSHGFFGFMDLEGMGVTSSFAFTSVTLTATVAPQHTGNGTENYAPHHGSSMRLFYTTVEPGDPGNFVFIVPAGSLPFIEVGHSLPETGVDLTIYGRAGRTHVVECSPDTVTWTAIGTGVMPQAASMPIRDASASSVGTRFYRVVELP